MGVIERLKVQGPSLSSERNSMCKLRRRYVHPKKPVCFVRTLSAQPCTPALHACATRELADRVA